MTDRYQRLRPNSNPFDAENSSDTRRKPLRSSQPSEELLLSSGVAQNSNYYEGSRVDRERSIPLRHLAPFSVHDVKRPDFSALPKRVSGNSQWRPGFWARFPFLGIIALVMVVFCTFAAVVVSILSNKKIVESWTVSPSVLLSITSTLSNIFLSFALAEGLVISFWRTSLHGSSASLHDNWYAGVSFWGAIRGGLRGNSTINSLACVLTVVSALRGPLFQRASTPMSGVLIPTDGNMTINLATDVPSIYGGIAVYSRVQLYQVSSQTPNFTKIMQAYSSNAVMSIDHPPCGDSCTTKAKGFGFRANCSQQTVYINETAVGPGFYSTYFAVSVGFVNNQSSPDGAPNPSQILLNATYLPENYTQSSPSDRTSIKGLVEKICILYGGIVAYDIILQNGTVQLTFDDYSRDDFVQNLDLPVPDSRSGGIATVLGGFEYAANYLFTSTATFQGGNAVDTNSVVGALANQFMTGSPLSPTFLDPTDYMINQMRQIAFRTSLQAAKDNATASNATQTVPYSGNSAATIYSTNFKLIVAAAALNFLAIIAILPTYRGWWALGRTFSLSPLEIARAFDAPLLRETESNATWMGISEHVGERSVRYGEIGKETGANGGIESIQLQFADAKDVRQPLTSSRRQFD